MGPVTGSRRVPPSVRLRALGARAGRWLSRRSYLMKWIVLGGVIGLIAGLGAVVFFEALQLSARFFLGTLVGFRPGSPVGEGGLVGSATVARPWLLPAVTGWGRCWARCSCSRSRRRPQGTAPTPPSTPCTTTRAASVRALYS